MILLKTQALSVVATRLHRVAPLPVGDIPFHRRAEAGLEIVGRTPPEFALYSPGVYSIASIVTRAVGHEGAQRHIAAAISHSGIGGGGRDGIERRADPFNH